MKGKKMNWGKRFVLALALLGVTAATAWADDSEVKKNEALALYDEGKALMSDGDFKKAEQKYLAAQRAFAMPRTAGMLGYVQVQQGNYLEGVRNLEWFFQEDTTVEAAKREQVRPQYILAKEHVATIKIKVDPIDALVSIDGTAIPANRVHWPQYVAKGSHSIEAKKEGFGTEKQGVTVVNGTETEVMLTLVAVKINDSGIRSELKEPPGVSTPTPTNKQFVIEIGVATGFALLSLGTGIGAALEYTSLADAKARRVCDGDCDADVARRQIPMATLMWTWPATAVIAGVVGGHALMQRKPAKPSTTGNLISGVRMAPVPGGLIVFGQWQ